MVLKAEDVKLERGKCPELVAAGMEGRKFCSMQAGRPGSERGKREDVVLGRLAPPPGKRPIGKVLNPSCALIPRPGKRGGEGR